LQKTTCPYCRQPITLDFDNIDINFIRLFKQNNLNMRYRAADNSVIFNFSKNSNVSLCKKLLNCFTVLDQVAIVPHCMTKQTLYGYKILGCRLKFCFKDILYRLHKNGIELQLDQSEIRNICLIQRYLMIKLMLNEHGSYIFFELPRKYQYVVGNTTKTSNYIDTVGFCDLDFHVNYVKYSRQRYRGNYEIIRIKICR